MRRRELEQKFVSLPKGRSVIPISLEVGKVNVARNFPPMTRCKQRHSCGKKSIEIELSIMTFPVAKMSLFNRTRPERF